MYFSMKYESNILGQKKNGSHEIKKNKKKFSVLMWIPIWNKYRCLAAENDKNLFEKYIYIARLLNMFIKEFLVGVLKWCGGGILFSHTLYLAELLL